MADSYEAYSCIGRAESAETVAEPDLALIIVTDGMKAFMEAEMQRPGNYSSPYFALYGEVEQAFTVDEAGLVELNTGLEADSVTALTVAAGLLAGFVDCSTCDVQTTCRAEAITAGIGTAGQERLQRARVLEKFYAAPTWMQAAWAQRLTEEYSAPKAIQRALQDPALAATQVPYELASKLVYLPRLKVLEETSLVPANEVEGLQNINGIRDQASASLVILQAATHQVKIYDARDCVTANNAQDPNLNDEATMLLELLERSAVSIGNTPALQAVSGNYRAISSYKGYGSLFEFRLSGEGSKSRLYGIASAAGEQRQKVVDFTILGASSGNGNDAQDQFLAAIGFR